MATKSYAQPSKGLVTRLAPQRVGCSPSRAQQRSSRDLQAHASSKLGVHGLVFAGDWSHESCEKAVKGAAKAGYDLIEVPLLDPTAVDTEHTQRVLQEYGVSAASSLGLSPDKDVNNEDSEVVRKGEDVLDQALTATAAMGGSYMVGCLYTALHKYPGPCSSAARANVVRAMQTLADKAADKGVTLGLEVVNRYETNVANTTGAAMELLADINRPQMCVHLDAYHANIEELSMAAAVQACGDRLGYVHIGESHRGYLGTGSVDFQGLFEALARAKYDGPVTFESFSSSIVSKDLSNTLCVWRNLWEDSDDLAKHAHSYMTVGLHAARQGVHYNMT